MVYMRCIPFSSVEKRPRCDACIVPFCKDDAGKVIPLFEDDLLMRSCHHLLEAKDFSAKEAEEAVLYPDPATERRLVLIGLGDRKKITPDSMRTSVAHAVGSLTKKKASSIALIPPALEGVSSKVILKACIEGVFYGAYAFRDYLTQKKEDEWSTIAEIHIFTSTPHVFAEVENETRAIMEAVAFARDLVNRNADEITPEGFAAAAQSLADEEFRVSVHGKEWIEREQMGLLLAVGQGARYEPRFVIAEWKGAPNDKDITVLIGKGITFDTGGLDLKSTDNMQTMKEDMSGAASVLAVMKAVKELRLPLNVTAAIPLCENSISANSYKPGDVLKARSGKTIEIMSTDAEGRLILADALDYAVSNLSPSRIIDVATLTGSATVALGKDISALFSNTDSLAFLLERASHQSGDLLWRMPLYMPYAKLLESDIADCKNVATRSGGAINAAVFLSSFVGTMPWAHLDIAGTAFLKEPCRYYGKGATGVPVRTLLRFLESLIPGIIPELEPEEDPVSG
jgi:leucyl aminopeptidase